MALRVFFADRYSGFTVVCALVSLSSQVELAVAFRRQEYGVDWEDGRLHMRDVMAQQCLWARGRNSFQAAKRKRASASITWA